jgi:tetratricopeptide (TPR) repeat protein
MIVMIRLVRIIILLLFCGAGSLQAQEKSAERYLDVRGTSELDMQPLSRATANLYEGQNKVKSVQTGSDGSFSFRLEMNKQYTIEVEKDGLVSKRISFNTTLPDEEKGTWMNEFSIGLVKKCTGVDYSVLKEPVDKISFDSKRREFVSDKNYVSGMRSRIENMLIKNDQCMLNQYESAVKKGDQLAAQKNFQEALAAYNEAQEIYPTEMYPGKRISEINNQISKQQNNAEVYKKLIEEADALASQQRYTEALQKYKGAAIANPQEAYARQKVAEIEKAMAQEQASRQAALNTEDKYNQAMAKASVAYTRKDYPEAKQYYQEAMALKPAEPLPQTRMQEIETILSKKAADDAARAAESSRKAAFENDYKALIAQADGQYKAKQFEEARQNYAKALTMKPSDPYPAQRVKAIEIAAAAEQAAKKKSIDDAYEAAMVAANNAIAKNQFPLAQEQLQKALTLKPGDVSANNRVAEVNGMAEDYAERKSQEEQYKKVIATADGYMQQKDLVKARETYTQALALRPGDQYAQNKIATIDFSYAAEQAAKVKATEEGYKAAINAANTAITQRSYSQAKDYLNKALVIKPGDVYATGKSAEVDHLIEEQRKQKEQEQVLASQYQTAITAADQSFSTRDYGTAKISYNKALQLKPGDTYANQKIASIENILAAESAQKQKQLDDAYKGAMDRGSSALIAKEYQTAKNAFQEALAVKPADLSAKSKIAETDLLIRQAEEKLAADQARKLKYDENIKMADQYLAQKNFVSARAGYEQALNIKPGEGYPRQKLDEISKAIAEQEKLLADQQARENAYQMALASGDKFFRAKEYLQAREDYNRALLLKPDEAFPKNKVAEIDNLITARQKEQEAAKAKTDAYAAAITSGNGFYAKKDYLAAKNSYNEALKQMPADPLATDQIRKIDYLLAEAEKQKQADAARKASYESLIKSADNAFEAGKYLTAKEDYKSALAVEPTSVYAKQRIVRIDEINRALSQATAKSSVPVSTGNPKSTAAIPMGELNFKTESERQKYLEELKLKYPDGITLEKYKERYKETYRYIIIRDNQAQEYRRVKFNTYNGEQYSVNGKPITQQYFLSQVKTRQGESYQEKELQ